MKLSPECTFLLLASLCASAGAVSDARSRRIPNLLTGTSIVFGLLLHLETGGWRQMGMAAAAVHFGKDPDHHLREIHHDHEQRDRPCV